MDIKKLIEKLPVELRPFAQSYINSLVNKTEAEITVLVTQIMAGNWEAAYKSALKGMSLEELKNESERLKGISAYLNDASKKQKAEQEAFVAMLLQIAFAAAKAYVGL